MTGASEPPEDWRAAIRREEIYREEVRRTLVKPSPRGVGARTWAFLNTSLGLWVLSAIGVAGVTSAYAGVQARMAAEQAREARIAQLDLEIEWRLSQFLSQLQAVSDRTQEAPVLARTASITAVQRAWSALKAPPDGQRITAVYPEYERRGLLSLMVELQSLVPGERHTLAAAAAAVATDAVVGPDLATTIQQLFGRLLLARWRTVTPFVDCTPQRPFC